jgi:glycosyltransferase involved in cell wall biosynthesis
MQNIKPKISVIMPIYNCEEYLKEAVESILNQTFTDFEFIIVNDGSTDKSLSILREFEQKDKRIKIISRENKGLIYSLNEGIKLAQGKYVARMDGDDVSFPERFEKQVKFMEDNKLAVCGTWATVIDPFGNIIKYYTYPPVRKNKIRLYSFFHCPFIHPSVMLEKEILEKVGGYKNYKNIEDYELWTRIIYKNNINNIGEMLIKYRIHDNQITKNNKKEMKLKGLFIRILALWRFIFKF